MQIYIARHGQTASNVRQTYLGHTDAALNEEGIKQARQLAGRLASFRVHAVYTSPLKRAVQTTQEIVARNGALTFTMSYAVQERDYGIFDDLTLPEIKTNYPDEYCAWQKDWTGYRIPQGESAEEVHERCGQFLKKAKQLHREQSILVVTHLGAARHLIAGLLGLSAADSYHFFLDNARYALVEVNHKDYGVLRGCNL